MHVRFDHFRRNRVRSRLAVGGTVAASLILFALLASSALPAAMLQMWSGSAGGNPTLTAALLLNVALLLLSWRRSRELRQQSDARAEAEARILSLASQDYTTGLLNRAMLNELAQAHLHGGDGLTLLVIDLDHFKKVNDLYGHCAGDALLKTVAEAIRGAAPPEAFCARTGGDEFALVLTGHNAQPDRATAIAQAVLDAIAEPIAVDGGVAHVGASVGIASTANGERDFALALRRGDIAMYHAKRLGRNCFAWFDTSMEREVMRQTQLEADIRIGIPAGEFVPYYQAQYNLQTGALHGFEVLARWNHPVEGLLEPSEFITLAEDTGLIASLSLSVMAQALAEARHWDPKLMIAVNLSPIQLKDPTLDQRIMKLLTETGFPARRLELEVTESALFDDMELALSTIESLKALGITISLDDFGTGYSSLAQLQALPFDRIKIDRSFVLSMMENQESAAIVNAITTLGENLKLPITAEGIESDAVGKSLKALGCSEGQGWLYGKPAPAREILASFPHLALGSAGPDPVRSPSPADPAEAAALPRPIRKR